MESTADRLALDIETISPQIPREQDPEFVNPGHFEVLAVGVGEQHSRGHDPEADVVFRERPTAEAEYDVIRRAVEWLERHDHDHSKLLTYNGVDFDFEVLRGRVNRLEPTVGDPDDLYHRLDLLDDDRHFDLMQTAWDRFNDYPGFEDACSYCDVDVPPTKWRNYDHNIDLDARRSYKEKGKDEFGGGDVPLVGEDYLEWRVAGRPEADALEQMLRDYTEADITPLFHLGDELQTV